MDLIRRLLFAFVVAGLSGLPAAGLEIPLTGGTGGSGAGETKIAYVDMERIFQIYPQTKYAREDYLERLEKKREALQKKEQELLDIRNRVKVLEATLQDYERSQASEVQKSTGTDVAVKKSTATDDLAGRLKEGEISSNAVRTMKQELEEKEAELKEAKQRAAQDLESFEQQQAQIILGKLYEALRQLAEEEQISLVIDKSSILYGSATIDLTDKLQERVRGY